MATQDDGSCTYSCAYYGLDEVFVTLYDSFGDGWNGNTLTVGTETLTLAMVHKERLVYAGFINLYNCNI